MEEFAKTSCMDLIALWLDLSRPQNQWKDEGHPGDWNDSLKYSQCIEKIENAIPKN